MFIRCIYTNDMLPTDIRNTLVISGQQDDDKDVHSSLNRAAISDNRIHIRNGRQTARITVTITTEQDRYLRSLVESSGFNASELVRYALLQLFRNPHISLAGEHNCTEYVDYQKQKHKHF
jgi:16S rRNA U516 pseudouridylate synthase RsuA-like enzyme